MDFSFDGTLLVKSSEDNNLSIFLAREGTHRQNVPVKKYGAGTLRFLRDRGTDPVVVTASTPGIDHQIRAVELTKCSYLRYFGGHEDRVVGLAASPTGPYFLSASRDLSMRLWDARQPHAVAKLPIGACPAVAFDPKGVVFGVAYASARCGTVVKLYDAKQYQQGPFIEFALSGPKRSWPTCFKFSTDGEYFLLTTADVNPVINVYDAYKGAKHRDFSGHRNDGSTAIEASFSPDSRYLATGSHDGSVLIWDIASEKLLLESKNVHALPVTSVMWNPVYASIASACQKVALWIPDPEKQTLDD